MDITKAQGFIWIRECRLKPCWLQVIGLNSLTQFEGFQGGILGFSENSQIIRKSKPRESSLLSAVSIYQLLSPPLSPDHYMACRMGAPDHWEGCNLYHRQPYWKDNNGSQKALMRTCSELSSPAAPGNLPTIFCWKCAVVHFHTSHVIVVYV